MEDPAWRYVPFLASFAVVAGVLTSAAARRPPVDGSARALTEHVLATFFVARAVAHEKVGSPVRAPFVEPEPGAPADDVSAETKRPAGEGLRRTAGELITCTRCLGPWAAAAFTYGNALAPRHAQPLTRVAALAGANILLQGWFAQLVARANR